MCGVQICVCTDVVVFFRVCVCVLFLVFCSLSNVKILTRKFAIKSELVYSPLEENNVKKNTFILRSFAQDYQRSKTSSSSPPPPATAAVAAPSLLLLNEFYQ